MDTTPLTLFTAVCTLGCFIMFIKTLAGRDPDKVTKALAYLTVLIGCIWATTVPDHSNITFSQLNPLH